MGTVTYRQMLNREIITRWFYADEDFILKCTPDEIVEFAVRQCGVDGEYARLFGKHYGDEYDAIDPVDASLELLAHWIAVRLPEEAPLA